MHCLGASHPAQEDVLTFSGTMYRPFLLRVDHRPGASLAIILSALLNPPSPAVTSVPLLARDIYHALGPRRETTTSSVDSDWRDDRLVPYGSTVGHE